MKKTDWIKAGRYLNGEADQAEMNSVEHNRETKLLVNDLKQVQKMIDDYKKMKKVDVDKAWGNVLGRITASPEFRTNKKEVRLIPLFMKIAASVALIAGLFFTYRLISSDSYLTAWSTGNDTVVTLSDGSKVYLNSGSEIKYPAKFKKDRRDVIISGEAFFEVTHDASRPFYVTAGNSKVKVLGTSFLVNKKGKTVQVYVETGKVSFFKEGKENTGILLSPGEIGTMDKNSLVSQKNTNTNILAWKTKKIVFTNETFSEMVSVLEKVYQVNIRIKNPENGNCTHAAKFNKEKQSIGDVLKVLGTESYTFTRTDNGDEIVIDLKGCKIE